MRRLVIASAAAVSLLLLNGNAFAQGSRQASGDGGTRLVLVLSGAALGGFAVSAFAPVAWATTAHVVAGGVVGGIVGNWLYVHNSDRNDFLRRTGDMEAEAPTLFQLVTDYVPQ